MDDNQNGRGQLPSDEQLNQRLADVLQDLERLKYEAASVQSRVKRLAEDYADLLRQERVVSSGAIARADSLSTRLQRLVEVDSATISKR